MGGKIVMKGMLVPFPDGFFFVLMKTVIVFVSVDRKPTTVMRVLVAISSLGK